MDFFHLAFAAYLVLVFIVAWIELTKLKHQSRINHSKYIAACRDRERVERMLRGAREQLNACGRALAEKTRSVLSWKEDARIRAGNSDYWQKQFYDMRDEWLAANVKLAKLAKLGKIRGIANAEEDAC